MQKTYPMTITTEYGSDTYQYLYNFGSTMTIVDETYYMTDGGSGNVILDLDSDKYALIVNSFLPRIPAANQVFAEGMTDYSKYIPELTKLENIELPFSVRVKGSTESELRANVSNLLLELRRDTVYIAYSPPGRPLVYYLANPVAEADTDTYWYREFEDAHMAVVSVTMTSMPPCGVRESLEIVGSTGINDSFEIYSDIYTPLAWDTYEGYPYATIQITASQCFVGSVGLEIQTHGGWGGVIDSAPRQIDKTHPYNIKVYGIRVGDNAANINVKVHCYDASDTELGTLDIVTNYNISEKDVWLDIVEDNGNSVIYPSDSFETLKWIEGTTSAKIEIISGPAANFTDVVFDCIVLTDAYCLADNTLEGTAGIVVREDEIKGDLPAPLDLHISSLFSSSGWREYGLPNTQMDLEITGMSVRSEDDIWACGIDYNTTRGVVFHWDGINWTLKHAFNSPSRLNDIKHDDLGHIWVVGSGIWLSTDGINWQKQKPPDWHGIFASPPGYRSVAPMSSTDVIVVGGGSDGSQTRAEIIRKKNGVWTRIPGGVIDVEMHDVVAIPGYGWFAVGSNTYYKISKNVKIGLDGTIETKYIHYYVLDRAVCATDSTHIWVAGQRTRPSSESCLYFFDGDNWTEQNLYSSAALLDIDCKKIGEDYYVWAVGNGGMILSREITSDLPFSRWVNRSYTVPIHFLTVVIESKDSIWISGTCPYMLRGPYESQGLNASNIIVGQRDKCSENYNPALDIAGEDKFLITRRNQHYKELAAGETAEFRFNIGDHEGRYLVTAGITFSNTTAYDKANIKLRLQTLDGVDITSDIAKEIDLGDPNTIWKEIALLATRFTPIELPSHILSKNANKGQVNQLIYLTADASLGAVKLLLDHLTLIPTDVLVEITDTGDCQVILSSSDGAVLLTPDGTLEAASFSTPSTYAGTPAFEVRPDGINMTILVERTVSDNHELMPFYQLRGYYRPRYLLTPGE